MERNANYALVGLISTILLIGMIVFIFWLANFAFSQRYDDYHVIFHGPVTGLTRGGDRGPRHSSKKRLQDSRRWILGSGNFGSYATD